MRALIVGAAGAVIGVLLALVIISLDFLPTVASTQGERVDFLWDMLILIAGAIFGLVTAVLLYNIRTFRGEYGETRDGPPQHGITWLEITWTAVPTVIVAAIVAASWIVLNRNDAVASDRQIVVVHGFQYDWAYDYPAQGVYRSNQLVLPVDGHVDLKIVSDDLGGQENSAVIHSFWVPSWRLQLEATPGIVDDLPVTPNRIGTYQLICAFLCGTGHGTMNSEVKGSAVQKVRVVSRADYDKWLLTAKKQFGKKSVDDPQPSGRSRFEIAKIEAEEAAR